jgi:hypothetical protein
MKSNVCLNLSLLGLTACLAPMAHADTLGSTTVNATDSVYAAGAYASDAAAFGGTAPVGIAIAPGVTSITFSSSTGATVTVNGGGNYNDADGIGSASSEVNTGFNSLSGISSPTAGYIAGVFLTAGGPDGTAPAALDFDGTGGTSFTSLSAAIDQVFYVGDGLTGDGTGTTQTFYVPTGATELYLGLADACGYYGGPSCLGDNAGSFSVNYDEHGSGTPPPPPSVPEPSSLVLLGTGVLAAAGTIRRRFVTC